MSELKAAGKALCFASILFHKNDFTRSQIVELWSESFGESFSFYHDYFPMKDYYSKEMGDAEALDRLYVVGFNF